MRRRTADSYSDPRDDEHGPAPDGGLLSMDKTGALMPFLQWQSGASRLGAAWGQSAGNQLGAALGQAAGGAAAAVQAFADGGEVDDEHGPNTGDNGLLSMTKTGTLMPFTQWQHWPEIAQKTGAQLGQLVASQGLTTALSAVGGAVAGPAGAALGGMAGSALTNAMGAMLQQFDPSALPANYTPSTGLPGIDSGDPDPDSYGDGDGDPDLPGPSQDPVLPQAKAIPALGSMLPQASAIPALGPALPQAAQIPAMGPVAGNMLGQWGFSTPSIDRTMSINVMEVPQPDYDPGMTARLNQRVATYLSHLL